MGTDTDEDLVAAVTRRFYGAIDEMARGDGLESMRAVWHHGTRVTTKHPSGEWAIGWDQVWATWEVFASFGAPDRGGGVLESLDVFVFGDVAYATASYRAAPKWGAEVMMCTNVLRKIDGTWKIVHHHADRSPAMEVALEKMLEG